MRRHAKRVGIFVLGWALIITGIVLIPLPGPGWLIIFVGLAVLAREFEWAERRQDQLKAYYHRKKAQVVRHHRERVEDRQAASDAADAAEAAEASEAEVVAEVETTAAPPPILAAPARRDGRPTDR